MPTLFDGKVTEGQELRSATTWVHADTCAHGIHVAAFFEGAEKSNCVLCINTPLLSVGRFMMVGLTIHAYEHLNVGTWLTRVYGFLATGSGGALGSSYQHVGDRDRLVRWAVNPSGHWCLLIGAGTGSSLTDDWAYPHIIVDAMLSFGSAAATNDDLIDGWSIAFPSDITSYTSLTTVPRKEAYAVAPINEGSLVSTTVTFDLAVSRYFVRTLDGNYTGALANVSAPQAFQVDLVQDGTGGRTWAWWSGITWAGDTEPEITTTAGKRDCFGFRYLGSGSYLGFVLGQNY